MSEFDGKMWQLFKHGMPPKEFFEKPTVKKSMKQAIEEHREDELLKKAALLLQEHLLKKSLELKAFSREVQTDPSQLEHARESLKKSLLHNRPLREQQLALSAFKEAQRTLVKTVPKPRKAQESSSLPMLKQPFHQSNSLFLDDARNHKAVKDSLNEIYKPLFLSHLLPNIRKKT